MSEKAIDTARVLVVSRESSVLRPLWSIGEANSWQLESAASGWGAMERVQAGGTPDLLLLDLPRSDKDGFHLLRWLRRLRPELPIILILDANDEARQQEAVRLGARDCMVRPLEAKYAERVIKRHLSEAVCSDDTDITSDDVEPIGGDAFFVAASPVMRKLRAQAELLAVTNVPVLILGESGSGKDTIARLIHKLSIRSGAGFMKVNCAALPSDLLEVELFGHERNESGRPRSKPGKLELCEKGTVLLDEITEMSMALQARLVQVLQQGRFAGPGIGSSRFGVRVLAASTTNVEPAISENKLREDLYYLMSAYTIHVPPLRQRREEVPLLLRHFMRHLAKHYGLSPRSFSPAVVKACQSHSWPGNLRELESFVKRYLLGGKETPVEGSRWEPEEAALDDNSTSTHSAISLTLSADRPGASTSGDSSLKLVVQNVRLEAEKNAIAAALERTGWNRKAAARLLKVSYRTLLYKIEQHQMRSPDSSLLPGRNGFKGNGHGFSGNGSDG
jgi:DNA-binding NtrC family response regulator